MDLIRGVLVGAGSGAAGTTRRVLAKNLLFLISKYQPAPMSGEQREFE